jgi:D-alanine-D-alanine ligase
MRLTYQPERRRRVSDPRDFGRVAVLFGGDSSEREISLLSGNAVLEALKSRGVDAQAFDPRDLPLADLIAARFERVWIALHGPGGEDGTLQGALEYLGVPYTGSGVMGSAIGMDKLRTKRLAGASGVPTADFVVLRGSADFELALERLKLPLIVKPATQGSSVGMTKVERPEDLAGAFAAASSLESLVFAEPWLPGKEYTVAILQDEALPSIRIETPKTFYDYEAKYFRDDTRYFCPSGLAQSAEAQLGTGGFHDGRRRATAAARDQHHSGNDEPQPRADGRTCRRHRLCRAHLARARNELHTGACAARAGAAMSEE